MSKLSSKKLTTSDMRRIAVEMLKETPGGMRVGEIAHRILETYPNSSKGTVWTTLSELPKKRSDVTKPSRGVLQLKKHFEEEEKEPEPSSLSTHEAVYYEPFAEWLTTDLEEASVAVALGGGSLKTKWGTPDVIGVYKPAPYHIVQAPPELIAAEIKVDPHQPIVAFGQAVSYRLFASRAYIVLPAATSEADRSRLDAMAMLMGVGLVFFEPDPDNPEFQIRVRAQRSQPDVFWINEFVDRLRKSAHNSFEQLFK